MKQGEVWLINLDPTHGAEIKKTRPAVIVNENSMGKLPLKIIVPITDWKEHFAIVPWMVEISPSKQNGLDKPSAADCFQIRSVSELRLIKKIGSVSIDVQQEIKVGLSKALGIDGDF